MKLKRAWITLSLALALLVPQLARADDQPLPGFIYTFAGNGQKGYGGDGALAVNAVLDTPSGMALDSDGSLYFVDRLNHRVRTINTHGVIATFAGTGTRGFSGDGGPATQAQLNFPTDVGVDSKGNLFIAESGNDRIRKVDKFGVITTSAGNGLAGYSGDGGPATDASLDGPRGLAFDGADNLYFADHNNSVIRRVDAATGVISRFAGTGASGFTEDGGPATLKRLNEPSDVAFDAKGNLYIADTMNYRIRRVDRNGIIETVVGNGQPYASCTESTPVPVPPYVLPRVCLPVATNGDGFTAKTTSVWPGRIVFAPNGDLLIGSAGTSIKRWDMSTDRVFTVAGTGQEAYAGDGGPAKFASFTSITGMAMMGNEILVADSGANRIRIIHDDGVWGSN